MTDITSPTIALDQIAVMGDSTRFEADAQPRQNYPRAPRQQSHSLEECISHLATPRGPKAVLKTMVTTACERNCFYCPFRAGRGPTKRVTFTPDALAGAFDTLVRSKKVDGLFLSSGIIKGSVTTQDKLIDTVEIVRRKYRYRGYVHLKIMPGVERDQLYRAMQIADRISVNLEAPTQERLAALAPKKIFMEELLQMLRWANQLRQDNPQQKLASTVTQFVVGAVGDTDLELLSLSDKLYHQLKLARVYYSAFSPVPHTPFEENAPTAPMREFRLYQASFLLRDYGWNLEDLPFEGMGGLRQDIDPKRAFADVTLRHAPVDLQHADREQLMSVPNIGPKTADTLIQARRQHTLSSLEQLRVLGVRQPDTIAPYILLNGNKPPVQMSLFPET